MTIDGGWPSAATGLGRLLLDAKFRIPPAAAGLVSRHEIIDKARASPCRIVGITAPPGYGKSTLLAQWARTEERQVAWLSLDRLDDDPAVLVNLLTAAFARAAPLHDHEVAGMPRVGPSALARSAPNLAAILTASPRPFVLIIDDLHELRSAATRDVLSVVIPAIPAGSQLVTASRDEQPHLPRLRAAGDVLELTARDLALDPRGAQQMFAEARVDLTVGEAAALVARTEGWPAGLYLASLMSRDSREPVLQVSGDDRYIADYLHRETLSQLDDGVQEFLRRSAVLDLMSGPLCDAVLDRQDSQACLRELEASNRFVFAVDRRRQWYRYHPLFREFLLGDLKRVEPEAMGDLHLRAADWYEANGPAELAVEHLLETDDRRRCAELVARVALSAYQGGRLATVQRWLETLGDLVKDYPPLAVWRAWLAASTGQTEEALRWAAFVEAASFDARPVDGTASFESARAMLRAAMCADGPEQALRDARLAVEQEKPWSARRDQALYLDGEARLLVGDQAGAAAKFAESADVAERQGNAEVLVLSESELAWLAMDHGNWEEAARHVEAGVGTIEEYQLQDYAASVLAYSAAARLDLHRGDRKHADRSHRRAMRSRVQCTFALPFISVRGRIQLAKVSWATGDRGTTRHLLREIDDILRHRPSLGTLVDEVDALRTTVKSAGGHGGGGDGPAPLTPAELRLLPYLQTHLTVAEIGERLFISRNTASTEIASIYRKLGVSSRSAAVQEALAIGLLGE